MRKLYQAIHSPTALLAFEAAARLGSFTRAATELNVSQPAISASVKKLEDALQTKLFDRKNRAIVLTEAGERFYSDVSFGLMHILRSAQNLSARTISRHVTLNCSTAFAHYWMVPRLSQFKQLHPEIDLRLQTTDRDIQVEDDGSSLIVWRGSGELPKHENCKLIAEKIYPVVSSSLKVEDLVFEKLSSLSAATLLHLDEPYRLRPTWTDWFAAQNFSYNDTGGGLRFNDYALVLQACFAGEGIAMGWDHVVDRYVSRGSLKRIGSWEYDIGYGFYVSWPSGTPLDEDAEAVVNWLISESEQAAVEHTEPA